MTQKYPGGFVTLTPPTQDPALGAATPGIWTLDQALNAEVTRSWPMYDPYYKNVVLNLHGEGTNGAQNNTFLDSSASPNTITRNGNTTQGTFSPYGQGWSNYFDGSGDYLIASTGSAGSPGTGDFCVEAWIYPQNSTTMEIIGNLVSSGGSDTQWGVYMNTGSNYIQFQGWYTVYATAAAPALNTWSHVAACRSGTTLSLFLNGIRIATTTTANNFSSTNDIRIGAEASGTSPFTGYISNARFVKGSSVYSPSQATLTVPTAPLTAITNTSLLTCQSNRFVDNSASSVAITAYGNTSVQRFQPFLFNTSYTPSTIGGSGYFDGTGDYLSIAYNSVFTLSGDFTVEGWFYPTHAMSGQFGWYGIGSDASGLAFTVDNGSAYIYFVGVGNVLSAAVQANTWQHVAIVRNGTGSNNITLYINGVSKATYTSNASCNASSDVGIGKPVAGTSFNPFAGYISNFRVVKGTAVYTSAFTPPISPLTAVTNTSLLASMTNGAIVDNAMMNDLETVGNAQISTSVKKYGTGSMYFDGTGDFLSTKLNVPLILNSDFTLEAWVYPTTITGSSRTVYFLENGGNSSTFYITSAGILSLDIAGVANYALGSATVSINSWQHIAFVRSGTTLTGYINGVASGTATVSASLGSSGVALVGANSNAGGAPFAGYIDDLRITKGVARYVANFTPPTSQLQDQ